MHHLRYSVTLGGPDTILLLIDIRSARPMLMELSAAGIFVGVYDHVLQADITPLIVRPTHG